MDNSRKKQIWFFIAVAFVVIVGYILFTRQSATSNIGRYEGQSNGVTVQFTVYDKYEDYLVAQPKGLMNYDTKADGKKAEEIGYVFLVGTVDAEVKDTQKAELQNWHLELITPKGDIIPTTAIYQDNSIDATKYQVAFVAQAMQTDMFRQAIFCLNGESSSPIPLQKVLA